jgi:membrane protein
MQIKQAIPLLKDTYQQWSDHNGTRFGASLAFYTLLSMAPLLVIVAAVLALVFDPKKSQTELINQAQQMIGSTGADAVKTLLTHAQKPATGTFAGIIAFITLLFGASGVFTELQQALNIMWDAAPTNSSGFWGMIKSKLLSFGMVLAIGFILLVSLFVSATVAVVGKFFAGLLPIPAPVFEGINFIVSFAVITALFALLYKYVPAVRISWRDVIVGAVGTALLFTIGKFLLGLYLGKASVGSAYGAAGSLVALIVWVYYSAQIFYFGAEFTHVYAHAQGRKGTVETPAQERAPEPHPGPVRIVDTSKSPGYFSPPAAATAPLAMAATAGVADGRTRPVPAPRVPLPASAPASKPPRQVVRMPLRAHKDEKWKPLLAVGIGFLLGRFSIRNSARDEHHSFVTDEAGRR